MAQIKNYVANDSSPLHTADQLKMLIGGQLLTPPEQHLWHRETRGPLAFASLRDVWIFRGTNSRRTFHGSSEPLSGKQTSSSERARALTAPMKVARTFARSAGGVSTRRRSSGLLLVAQIREDRNSFQQFVTPTTTEIVLWQVRSLGAPGTAQAYRTGADDISRSTQAKIEGHRTSTSRRLSRGHTALLDKVRWVAASIVTPGRPQMSTFKVACVISSNITNYIKE